MSKSEIDKKGATVDSLLAYYSKDIIDYFTKNIDDEFQHVENDVKNSKIIPPERFAYALPYGYPLSLIFRNLPDYDKFSDEEKEIVLRNIQINLDGIVTDVANMAIVLHRYNIDVLKVKHMYMILQVNRKKIEHN